MSQEVTQYSLLISCPGDIESEVDLINNAVEEFNDKYTDIIGIYIRIKYWKKNAYAESGGKPQDLLNKQFVENCDAAIALLWTRFGSPTDKYGSGTEEEIEIMLEQGKQVFMYFSDKPLPPSKSMQNIEEYGKVCEFRNKYKDRGIFFTYSTDEEFSKMIFAHLTQYFFSLKASEDSKVSKPNLVIRGIDENGKICREINNHKLRLQTGESTEKYRNDIISLYQKISKMHVGSRFNMQDSGNSLVSAVGYMVSSFRNPVEIKEQIKECLTEMAETFEIELPEDFFDVGNLSKDPMKVTLPMFDENLEGTDDEIKKYKLILSLYEMMIDCSYWMPIEKMFSEFNCVELAIENNGTSVDEDIEVMLELDEKLLWNYIDGIKLAGDSLKYLTEESRISKILGIPSTSEYNDYDSSLKPQFTANSMYSRNQAFPLMINRDYMEEKEEKIGSALGYDCYFENEKVILKYKFDYVKHNTLVAFPAPIILRDTLKRLPYKITSKHSAQVIEGILE